MNLSLYKPNSKNAGCACNFSVGQSPNGSPAFYVSAIQQHGWNDKTKKANFSQNKDNPEKNINVKFNEWEIGSIISAFNNRHEYSSYHTFNDNSTSIKFTPWDKKSKSGEILPAFGMVLTRNGNQTFKVPLEPGETETLKSFMKRYLFDYFEKSGTAYKNKHKEEDSGDSQSDVLDQDEAPF
jgi:hypothetical protein